MNLTGRMLEEQSFSTMTDGLDNEQQPRDVKKAMTTLKEFRKKNISITTKKRKKNQSLTFACWRIASEVALVTIHFNISNCCITILTRNYHFASRGNSSIWCYKSISYQRFGTWRFQMEEETVVYSKYEIQRNGVVLYFA